jgi:hypothetical protein
VSQACAQQQRGCGKLHLAGLQGVRPQLAHDGAPMGSVLGSGPRRTLLVRPDHFGRSPRESPLGGSLWLRGKCPSSTRRYGG